MKILALDTATEGCSVSLGIGDRHIDRYVELERGHAEQLLPMIDAVLAEGGLSLSDLDAIAFGRGPGGFTGVRRSRVGVWRRHRCCADLRSGCSCPKRMPAGSRRAARTGGE
jgi:tRNA A37 threonylcarbamoyladenosine modification protein TsaB